MTTHFHKVVWQQICDEVVVLIPIPPKTLSELNSEKNYENCSTFAEVIGKIKVAYFILRHMYYCQQAVWEAATISPRPLQVDL